MRRLGLLLALWAACFATSVLAATSSSNKLSLRLVFSADSMNKYSVGSSVDVLRDYRALMTGCTGAIRAGRPCSNVPSNAQVVKNPSGSGNVMGVLYRRGAYATHGGSQWYTSSDQLAATGAGMLEYDVYFPSGFAFTKGGKLPGLFGGNYMCSGSKVKPNGYNCFSARLMWRENGNGETYFYVPRGEWTKVQQFIRLNTPGKSNGIYQLYINKRLVMSTNQLYMRATNNMKLQGLLFSTFMGGDDPSWAPKKNQWSYFRNIRLYAANS